MSVVINTNYSATIASNNLATSNSMLQKSLNRLSSGSKIVSLLFAPAQRALPNGLFDAGTRTGLVVEGVLVPWMLIHYGWRTSFSLVGFAANLIACCRIQRGKGFVQKQESRLTH